MFYIFLILFSSSFLAAAYQKRARYVDDRSLSDCGYQSKQLNAKVLFFFMVMVLSLYSGLRSKHNDTGAYILSYYSTGTGFSAIRTIGHLVDGDYLFATYQILAKTLLGNNYARYLTITAALTCGSNLVFFKRYAKNFTLSVFLFVASTYYSFTYAALRQCLAMALGIWAIPCFCRKQYVKGIVIVLLSALIHRYAILYLSALFFIDDIWSIKTALLIVGTIIVSVFFSSVFTDVADLTGYDAEDIVGTKGTTIYRVMIWLVPVILSLLYAKTINKTEDRIGKCIINLSLVGSLLMIIAGIGGANLIGRTAYYFYPFFIMAFSEIIHKTVTKRNTRPLLGLCYIFFFISLIVLQNRGSSGFFTDTMQHNSIMDLFSRTLEW